MVEFLENKSLRVKTIDSYGEGGFRIHGEVYFGNLFLFEEHLQIWDSISEITSFLSNCKNLDLLIFGTGSQLSTSDIHLLEISKYFSFGLECLDTPSACRLYNMLALEGRNLACVVKKIE